MDEICLPCLLILFAHPITKSIILLLCNFSVLSESVKNNHAFSKNVKKKVHVGRLREKFIFLKWTYSSPSRKTKHMQANKKIAFVRIMRKHNESLTRIKCCSKLEKQSHLREPNIFYMKSRIWNSVRRSFIYSLYNTVLVFFPHKYLQLVCVFHVATQSFWCTFLQPFIFQTAYITLISCPFYFLWFLLSCSSKLSRLLYLYFSYSFSPQISNPHTFPSWQLTLSSLQLSAVQDLDEGFAKLNVESGVDDRVDCAVEVTQPGDSTVQWGWDTAASAVGLQNMGQEERQPADDEHTLEEGRGCGSDDAWSYVTMHMEQTTQIFLIKHPATFCICYLHKMTDEITDWQAESWSISIADDETNEVAKK